MPPSDRFDQHGGDFFPPPSAPRAVQGGIRVQASTPDDARGAWWTRRWFAPLDAVGLPDRLSHGWKYARDGQLLSLEIGLGLVEARVQGTRREPYETRMTISMFTQTEWVDAAAALAAAASHRAQLLAGDMPEDIEAVFARRGLSLYPSFEDGDAELTCTCVDWARPCRHLAAAGYALGELMDRDPFVVFQLRGIERAMLLALMGGGAVEPSVSRDDLGPGIGVGSDAGTDPDSAGADGSSRSSGSIDLAAFWELTPLDAGGGAVDGASPGIDLQPPAIDAPLIRILGALPLWRGAEDFETTMVRMHRRFGTDARALDIAIGAPRADEGVGDGPDDD